MSIFQQILVNSNTSVLLLNTDTLPNNSNIVVLLSNANLPGRSVTVRDTTGNLSTTKNIIVSTTQGIHFLDGTSSITLNQPNAFVTVANRDPETWVLQNTFAFPAEESSANVNSVTANYIIASTIQAQYVFSTTQMVVSTFLVENVVGANDVNAYGNLYVGSTTNFFNTKGNAAVQASLLVVSTISTGGNLFVGEAISSLASAYIGGDVFIGGNVSTSKKFVVFGGLESYGNTLVRNFSTTGNIGFGSDVLMTRSVLYASTVSTLATETRTLSTGSLVAFQTIQNNLSTLGPNIGIGADVFMTQNTITASSTITNTITASNTIQTSSFFTSTLTSYTVTNLSTLSTSGLATFENAAIFNSTVFAKDLSISSLRVLGVLTAGSTVLSSLFVSDNTTVFNFSTLNNAVIGSSLFVNSGSIEGLRVFLSTATISNVLLADRISTTNFSASNTITLGSNSSNTIITISSISTGFYRGAQAAFSSIAGDGSLLVNLNAISSPSLTSTVAGLGQIYASTIAAGVTAGQLISTNIGLGSLGYISSGQAISGIITPDQIQTGVSTLQLTANNIVASNQFQMNFPAFAPNPAVKLEALAGGPIYQLFNSGGTNQLQVGVDGTGNAIIRSEWPFTQSQPLALYGSIVSVTGQEFQVTSAAGPNIQPFTQITGASVCTINMVATFGRFSNVYGDGQFLSNLPLSSILATVSSGLSTVALFTSNTSNYIFNNFQPFSTSVSTVALYTSNTSNYVLNNFQPFSTSVSTVAQYTSNTSNYVLNNFQPFSTSVSTVAQYTSNTSNYIFNNFQPFSTAVSTVAQYTSNTSNYIFNNFQPFSTAISTVAQYTSNTSNYFRGSLVDVSTSFSAMQLVVSSIGVNCNAPLFQLDVAGTGRFLTVSSQSMTVSSLGINCNAPSFALDIVGALRVSTISTNNIVADASLMYNFPPISAWQFIGPVNGIPTTPISVTTTFSYTGSYQSYTVPSDTTHIYIVGWGAAGRGTGVNDVNAGGGGACIKGFLPVTPGETLRIIVGCGGRSNLTIPTDEQGGGGAGPSPGGGRTAIQRVIGTDILTIGGGGGGGGDTGQPGGGGSANASIGQQGANGSRLTANNGNHGGGGGQTVGGTGGIPPISGFNGETGTLQQGGKCATNGNAGGGGGYYGGGGGGYYNDGLNRAGAGGGGSSLIINLLRYRLELYDAVAKVPGNSNDPLRTGNVAVGNDGVEPRNGGDGLLYITAWN